jgi:signal transduction histidine kinase/ActR/RegA family two-component response regulator
VNAAGSVRGLGETIRMRLASEFRLLAPLAVIALGAMAVFVISLMIWSHEVDTGARLREENLVRQGVLARVTEIEAAVAGQIDGGDAAIALDKPTAADFTRERLLVELTEAGEFDDIAVLDGHDAEIVDLPGDVTAQMGARSLVAEVRQAETELFADPGLPVAGRPIQRSAFTARGGAARLVTATLVEPAAGHVLTVGKAPIILTSQTVSSGLLDLMRDRFQVAPISAAIGTPPGPGLASVRFGTADDGPPLVLSWSPLRPGEDLLRRAAWPMLGVLLAFGGVGLVMMWQVRRAARELLASNRAQSEFLANMSHEIRTPLNGVVAVASALSRTELTSQQGELVEIIRTSGATLDRLLSDVLDLARIETGAVAIEREPFHLADAVRAGAALHRARAEEKAIALDLVIDPAAETLVVGDQVRLKQILTNLLSNAIKFTSEGGVTLEVTESEAGDWRFAVEDSGVGFEPALRDRIFNRFQQADGSVTRRFGGTGLGLAICKQLAELMDGGIEAIGRPGVGARFVVTLPLARCAATAPAPGEPAAECEPAEDGLNRRLRVLLADDHPTNRRVVEVLLSGLEVDLVATENGLQACEAFETAPFDAVLMDMQMPVMDGLSATRRIRAFETRERLAPAFVVMLTANALRDHEDASLAAGADLHLPKPIEAPRLFAALEEAGRQALQSRAA